MFSGNKKYLFLLLLVFILLPIALIALYEYSSLKQNEEVIAKAYTEQLDAILFSVNQYSDDILNATVREIHYSFQDDNSSIKEIQANNGFIVNFSLLNEITTELSDSIENAESIKNVAQEIVESKSKELKRLKEFYEVGYHRLEPFPVEGTKLVLFVFVVKEKGESKIAALTVDALAFIRERLDPQMQKIANDQFRIVVLNKNNKVIYSTPNSGSGNAIELTSSLQSFSEYNLGIALNGQTIEDLVRERSKENLMFIGMVSIILLLAGWLVIRVINKQVELASLKSDFVSSVSHEIRTPLSLINMYAETIEMGRVSSEEVQKSFMQTILQETKRLSTMVNKILNFSEIEKKKKQYSFSQCDFNSIVRSCYESYVAYMEQLGFEHILELDKKVDSVYCDEEAVKDVLVNLIDNAIKYSFEQKSICIKTYIYTNRVCFSVEDKGIGIADKNKKYLFDKFYRVVNNDVSIKVKGSGLGLSIVKHIVDAHNGKIEISSTIGKGSRFVVSLPLNN